MRCRSAALLPPASSDATQATAIRNDRIGSRSRPPRRKRLPSALPAGVDEEADQRQDDDPSERTIAVSLSGRCRRPEVERMLALDQQQHDRYRHRDLGGGDDEDQEHQAPRRPPRPSGGAKVTRLRTGPKLEERRARASRSARWPQSEEKRWEIVRDEIAALQKAHGRKARHARTLTSRWRKSSTRRRLHRRRRQRGNRVAGRAGWKRRRK